MAVFLVTGAAGFIGAKVSEFLLKDGHSVIGVDNLNNAYDIRLKEYRLKLLENQPGFTFYKSDISQLRDVEKIFLEHKPIQGVINLAARAGVRYSVEDPWTFLKTNTTGTLNLLDCCRQYQTPKFVQASTSSIYGNDAPIPTPETADSSRPLQPYAASKKAAEVMAHAYHFLHGLDVTIFRYFTVYGPAGRPDMVMFRFVQWIAEKQPVRLNGDGEQSRGFTYVDDIARGTILGLKPLGYEIINLGGHEVISINEMITVLEEYLGDKARIITQQAHKADMLTNLADIHKARSLLGWDPQVNLREGMRRMVDWYLANHSWTSRVQTP